MIKKLHIHFVENKTNLIFGPRHKMKCQAFMGLKVISKVNSVLKVFIPSHEISFPAPQLQQPLAVFSI